MSRGAYARLAEAYADSGAEAPPLRLTSRGLWHATPVRVAWEAALRLGARGSDERRLGLDAGMGDGRLLAALVATGAAPRRLLGVECDAELYRLASERLGRLGLLDRPGVVARLGDYERQEAHTGAGLALSDVDLVLSYPDGNEARLARLVASRCSRDALLCLISPADPPPPRAVAPGLERPHPGGTGRPLVARGARAGVASLRGVRVTQRELLEWYRALLEQTRTVPRDRRRQLDYEETAASAWLTEAETALAAVFPAGHPTRRNWGGVFENARALNIQARGFRDSFDAAVGVFEAAHAILASGRLGTLAEGIRAEMLAELLDHAADQLQRGRIAAAVLTAAAALELKLRHLLREHELPVPAEAGLRALAGAMGEAGDGGSPILTPRETRLVADWSALQDAALESPGEPGRSAPELGALLEGIRQLAARG